MLSRSVMPAWFQPHYAPSLVSLSFLVLVLVLVLKYHPAPDPLNVTSRSLVFMSRDALYESSLPGCS